MQPIHIMLLATLAIIGCMWASISEADLAQCEKRMSREVCIHSVMP